MPDKSPTVVLLTGATGYVGSSILAALLSHPTANFSVRIALRRLGSSTSPEAFLAAYPHKASRLGFYFIDSIEDEDALDNAAIGASVFIHTASPVLFNPKDNKKDALDPAINGTVNALKSAVKAGTIRTFVLMSSISAVFDFKNLGGKGFVYNSKMENPMTYEEAATVEDGMMVYGASKALAEKAAWDFMKKNKPPFTFTSICPVWVIGPSDKVGAKTPKQVGTSYYLTYSHIIDAPKFTPTEYPQFVDIRDISHVVLSSILHPLLSNNKRYLLSGGQFNNETAASVLRKHFPEQARKGRIADVEEKDVGDEESYEVDGGECERDFEFRYRSLEESVRDMGRQIFEWCPERP